MNAHTYSELASLSREELIAAHDSIASGVSVSLSYYLEELQRRDAEKIARSMMVYTRWIAFLTVVVTIATIVSLGLSVYVLMR